VRRIEMTEGSLRAFFSVVKFTEEDVERHPVIKDILKLYSF